MSKNVIILCAGDNSLHKNWLGDKQDFDLIIIYYGNSDEIVKEYQKHAKLVLMNKGQKWHLIYNFVKEYKNTLKDYDFFWFPDDDLDTNVNDLNKFFEINTKFKLWLSQPSLTGYVSYEIERPIPDSILRFTNFVEIICPAMDRITLARLVDYFNINESGWGLDYLWPKILSYPTNKIAIVDAITVEHTKQIGGDYTRFKKEPIEELKEVFAKYNLTFNQQVFSIQK